MELLISLVVLAIVSAPYVLSIAAFIRIQKLRKEIADARELARRISVLERRIDWLRDQLKREAAEPAAGEPLELTGPLPPEAPAAEPAAEPSEPGGPPPIPPPPPPARRKELDLEKLIGGRVLNRIGIAAMMLAAAFFLKWAFDSGWIGPMGRLAMGFLGGTALLVFSHWLLRRGHAYFSEGITALGAGVLYLTLYAGRHLYDLIPEFPAFAGMVAVTLAFAILAVGRDSQRLAFLAFLGGYLTPILMSTGRDAQVELFTYLLILNAGAIVAALSRAWRSLEPLGFVWTVVYFAGWYDTFYTSSRLEITTVFAFVFFAEFLVPNVVRGRRLGRIAPDQVALVLANAGALLLVLQELLYREYRWTLTLSVVLLSAAHVLLARLMPARTGDASGLGPASDRPRLLLAALALTFITLAVPIALEGKWIAIAWAVEGTLLIAAGFRTGDRLLRGAGLAVLTLVPFPLVIRSIEAARPLLNPRFGSFVAVIACFVAAFWLSRRHRDSLVGQEEGIFGAVGIAANVFAVSALSMEAWDFAGWLGSGLDESLARQVGLSVVWTVYAMVLLVAGVRSGSRALRWQGLALLGLAVGKVFLHDLSFLRRGYRILSFVALGAVLLLISFLYQRDRFSSSPEEP